MHITVFVALSQRLSFDKEGSMLLISMLSKSDGQSTEEVSSILPNTVIVWRFYFARPAAVENWIFIDDSDLQGGKAEPNTGWYWVEN